MDRPKGITVLGRIIGWPEAVCAIVMAGLIGWIVYVALKLKGVL